MEKRQCSAGASASLCLSQWTILKMSLAKLGCTQCKVYLFGSYLRRKVFNDIDIMLVHISNRVNEIEILKNEINNCFSSNNIRLDFTICSEVEFLRMKLIDDNRERVF